MTFGFKNASGTFQRAECHFISNWTAMCLIYLSNIVVFSRSSCDYIENVEKVLSLLRDGQATVKLKKFRLFSGTSDNLDHVIRPCQLKKATHLSNAIKENGSTNDSHGASLVSLILQWILLLCFQPCTHCSPAQSEIKRRSTDALWCCTCRQTEGYAWTVRQNDVTTDTCVTINWRLLCFRYRRLQRPSRMCTATRTAKWDEETGWSLISLSDHNKAGFRHNTTWMFFNSLIRFDVTFLPRRHLFHNWNTSRLAKMDLEHCWRNRPRDTLGSLKIRIWFLRSLSCGN